MELPNKLSLDKDTVSTLAAGILVALVGKKLVNWSDDFIFSFFPSIPSWVIIIGLILVIYFLLGYGK